MTVPTPATWGLAVQLVLWGCALWFVRAHAAWETDLSALARVRRWGRRVIASYLLVLVGLLLVELVSSSVPTPVVLVVLLLLNSLALVLLLGVLGCVVWAVVLLARDWWQRRGPLAQRRELAEDARVFGQVSAQAGCTETELLAAIAAVCQEESWERGSAEAQRFELLARAAYQARWCQWYPDEEEDSL